MTDEERARLDNFIWSVGGLTDEAEIERHALAFEAAIRADEREKCAKLIDDHDEGFKVSSGERFLTARSDGNRSGLAYAAAIRAMGDKG